MRSRTTLWGRKKFHLNITMLDLFIFKMALLTLIMCTNLVSDKSQRWIMQEFCPFHSVTGKQAGRLKTQMFCFNYSSIRLFVQQQSTPHHENNLNVVLSCYSTSDSSWFIFNKFKKNLYQYYVFLKSWEHYFYPVICQRTMHCCVKQLFDFCETCF